MANPRTVARIAARIKERVAHCVEFELSDPRSSFITITRVEVARDLSAAKIYYSVLGTPGERSKAQHMLVDATGFVQRQLGRVLRTRRIPRLTWFYDESIEHAARMEKAIQEALRRDREINPDAHGQVDVWDREEDSDVAAEREYDEFLRDESDGEKAEGD